MHLAEHGRCAALAQTATGECLMFPVTIIPPDDSEDPFLDYHEPHSEGLALWENRDALEWIPLDKAALLAHMQRRSCAVLPLLSRTVTPAQVGVIYWEDYRDGTLIAGDTVAHNGEYKPFTGNAIPRHERANLSSYSDELLQVHLRQLSLEFAP
jgi:hypothetical protein